MMELCGHLPDKPIFDINNETNELEITKNTARTYQCIRIKYDEKSNKMIRTYYEEFVNEVGYEPVMDESHYEMSYPDMMKEIYSLFLMQF